jgi:hypothetical protein
VSNRKDLQPSLFFACKKEGFRYKNTLGRGLSSRSTDSMAANKADIDHLLETPQTVQRAEAEQHQEEGKDYDQDEIIGANRR